MLFYVCLLLLLLLFVFVLFCCVFCERLGCLHINMICVCRCVVSHHADIRVNIYTYTHTHTHTHIHTHTHLQGRNVDVIEEANRCTKCRLLKSLTRAGCAHMCERAFNAYTSKRLSVEFNAFNNISLKPSCYVYIYTCIRTYIHTYIHTYINNL